MTERVEFTVCAYDVADDKRRRRLVRVLEAWGERVQESVFEAWLTQNERSRLERVAWRCLDKAQDRLAIYGLPATDLADIVSLGHQDISRDFRHRVV